MMGFNEAAEGRALVLLLDRSREWIREINAAIQTYHKKGAKDADKAKAIGACLMVAQNVMEICCENRYCMDFIAKGPSGVRHSYDVLAAADSRYVLENDALFAQMQSDYSMKHEQWTQAGQKGKAPKAPQTPVFQMADSLPEGIDDGKRSEYEARSRRLMEIEPMYEAVDFSMGIIRRIRTELGSFEEKFDMGRRWKTLDAWQSSPENEEKALAACRRICGEALKARKDREVRLIEPFIHPLDPKENRDDGMSPRYLDVFDNEYSVLSEIAQAETGGALTQPNEVRILSPLLRGWMCRHLPGLPAPESVLLATYIWERMEEMGVPRTKRCEQWVCIGGGADAFGIYGDKRIAANGFMATVEKDQKGAGGKQLLKLLHMGQTVQIRLTKFAQDAFLGREHAVSPCSILAARVWHMIIAKELEQEEIKAQRTSIWFTIVEGEDKKLEDSDTELSVPSALWRAADFERRKGEQNHLKFREREDGKWEASLTSACAGRYEKIKNSIGSGEGLVPGMPKVIDAPVFEPEIKALAAMRTQDDVKTLIGRIAAENQTPNQAVLDAVEYLEKKRDMIAHHDEERDIVIRFDDTLSYLDEWIRDDQLKAVLTWLDDTLLPAPQNDPYLTLHLFMKPKEKESAEAPEAKDQLIWDVIQCRELEDARYAEAVWRIAYNANAFKQHILDCKAEIMPVHTVKNMAKYNRAALTTDTASEVKKGSSTWWMTRALRNVLAYAYKDEGLTPAFKASEPKWKHEKDKTIRWEAELDAACIQAENVEWLQDAICQCMAGTTWEALNTWRSAYKKDRAAQADFMKGLGEKQKAYHAFSRTLNEHAYRVMVIPAARQDEYAISVYDETPAIDRSIDEWVKSLNPADDAWMDEQEKQDRFIRQAKKLWHKRICAIMQAERRERLKPAKEKKGSSKPQEMLGVKTRPLSIALAAAHRDAARMGCRIESIVTSSDPYLGKDGPSQFKMTLSDGTVWDFDQMCSRIFSMRAESKADKDTFYSAFLEELNHQEIKLKTGNCTGKDGKVQWELTCSEKPEKEA